MQQIRLFLKVKKLFSFTQFYTLVLKLAEEQVLDTEQNNN
jgi:hypothetical protein